MANRARIRLLVAIVAALSVLVALVWGLSKSRNGRVAVVTSTPVEISPAVSPTTTPTLAIPSPSLTTQPSAEPTLQPSPTASTTSAALLIPVAGVRPEQLRDTFSEARSEGRVHDAIDIPAPRGTPVLAAADGRIVKLFQSERGGTTIYQLDPDNKTIYYYAHLERYADGLLEGHIARRGEVIAYVGDTGNAGAGNYHLHFSILIVSDPKRYWDGTNINPYPLLRGAQ
ncbi:MAG: peptidoglycan LD-endopeptidase LytH [Acidobacteriota bacterium]|jgi:murein DD-endopeptidase MepM/ murein hydrolase activator NlpD|nr:peptidoglycan LD-endopeptidase LytH [Acidobacteriota bacterium]